MTCIKPLFDIQKTHVEGSNVYYELYYKHDNQYSRVVEALFFTMQGAAEYRDKLLTED